MVAGSGEIEKNGWCTGIQGCCGLLRRRNPIVSVIFDSFSSQTWALLFARAEGLFYREIPIPADLITQELCGRFVEQNIPWIRTYLMISVNILLLAVSGWIMSKDGKERGEDDFIDWRIIKLIKQMLIFLSLTIFCSKCNKNRPF